MGHVIKLAPMSIRSDAMQRTAFVSMFATSCIDLARKTKAGFGWPPEKVANCMASYALKFATDPRPVPIPPGFNFSNAQVAAIGALNDMARAVRSHIQTTGPIQEGTLETMLSIARRAGLGEREVVLG